MKENLNILDALTSLPPSNDISTTLLVPDIVEVEVLLSEPNTDSKFMVLSKNKGEN